MEALHFLLPRLCKQNPLFVILSQGHRDGVSEGRLSATTKNLGLD